MVQGDVEMVGTRLPGLGEGKYCQKGVAVDHIILEFLVTIQGVIVISCLVLSIMTDWKLYKYV